MSAFSGPWHRGAMREHKEAKRRQAEGRNRRTPPERRKRNRAVKAEVK